MQRRFADHAAAQGSFDALFAARATYGVCPPLLPAVRLALGRSHGLNTLHINTMVDVRTAASLVAGLHAHAQLPAGASLQTLDLRFSRIGAAAGALNALGGVLQRMRVTSLDLSFCDVRAWSAGMAAYLRADTHLTHLNLRFNK